jgi:hypothetical protein
LVCSGKPGNFTEDNSMSNKSATLPASPQPFSHLAIYPINPSAILPQTPSSTLNPNNNSQTT